MKKADSTNTSPWGSNLAACKCCGARNFLSMNKSLLFLVVLLVGSGCSQPEERAELIGGGEGRHPGVAQGACEEGAQQECGYTLEQSADLVTCYLGVQRCEGGTWGPCEDGDLSEMPNPDSEFFRGSYEVQTLSSVAPVDCMDVCDPYCNHFVEPASGVTWTPGVMDTGSEFPGNPDGMKCEHDLCTEGADLENAPACDDCVATVCSVLPACCSSAWDEACVNAAYTECLGEPPPLDLCDFGLFATGTLTSANRPSAGAAMGSGGDLVVGTDAYPGMIATTGDLTVKSANGNAVSIPDGIWVEGNVFVQNGGGSSYSGGDWHVGGGIDFEGGITINADVYAEQNFSQYSSPTYNIAGPSTVNITETAYAQGTIDPNISGTKVEGSTHDSLTVDIPTSIPTRSATCPATDGSVTVNSGDTTTLAPGDYGDVTVQNGNATLILDPEGDYTFNSLTFNSGCSNCKLQLGTSGASYTGTGWDVTVCDTFSLEGQYTYVADGTGSLLTEPEQLVLYVDGADPGPWNYAATLGTDVSWVGVLMVPNGSFNSRDRATVNGAVWAQEIDAGTDLEAVGIDSAACEDLELPGTYPDPDTCPWDNTDPGAPPSTVEPCETALDCQMNQRCDDVSTNSACAHDKCVAGSALGADCDSCVAYVCDVDPSCCSSNWSSSCVEMVSTVCDAFCGSSGSGDCVENDGWSSEPNCTGYDLAAEYVCADTVTICNHGDAVYSGNIEVGYWDVADNEFAETEPDLAELGSNVCSGSVDIPPGDCDLLSCAMPSGVDYTLMVDPNGNLSECNDRRMDNWTWRDDDYTCVSTPDYAEYEYEAECPDDSQALWKNLTWESTVPTDSEVRFLAKVGDDLSDLSSQSYTYLESAEVVGSTDTTTCSRSGPAPTCPVPLTDSLSLGNVQGQMLSLRIELHDDGGAPTVDEWTVSYTCQFDQ